METKHDQQFHKEIIRKKLLHTVVHTVYIENFEKFES